MLKSPQKSSAKTVKSIKASRGRLADAQVMEAAIGLFEGNVDKAKGWLQKPARALGHSCPIDLLSTPAGVEAVLDLIGKIEHGIVI